MSENRNEYPVGQMCAVLGISRSSYYAWASGQTYKLQSDKAAVNEQVTTIFDEHKRRYGSRRIEAEMKAKGIKVCRYQIRKRMKEAGLKSIQPKSFVPKTTQTNPNLLRSPNLLLGMSNVDQINQVWVGDITYLAMADQSWTYLATWMDLNSRMIVGWQLSESLEADIALHSLGKAIARRQPKAGLIIHTDGGGQYMDINFRQLLKDNQFVQSMTRVENHYDNAFAESLFSRFKAELVQGKPFADISEAREKIFEYIEVYYNRKRRHSAIGYKSPQHFESEITDQNCQKTVLKMTA